MNATVQMRKCTKCEETKPLHDFYVRRRGKDNTIIHETKCKICKNKRINDDERKDKVVKKPWQTEQDYKFEYKLMWSYNMTLNEYHLLLNKQKNKCCTCGKYFDHDNMNDKPQIDHCHDTGKIRGLLCKNCNSAIGQIMENTNTLNNIINYLETHTDS